MNGVPGLTEIVLASPLEPRQRHHLLLVPQSADEPVLWPEPMALGTARQQTLAPLQVQAEQRGLLRDWAAQPRPARHGAGRRAALLLECRVIDTGIGMSPAQLARVFEPFVQADDSTTRRYGGTGLGLSIAGHQVRLIGGRQDATSQPGQGSCFRLAVPVQRLPAPAGALQAH